MVHDMVEHQHIGFPVNRRMQVFLASEKGMQFLLHLLTGNYTTVAMANKLYNKRVERDGRQHISHFAHILRMAKNLGWFTIWNNPHYDKGKLYDFVDYSFPNIYDALYKINSLKFY